MENFKQELESAIGVSDSIGKVLRTALAAEEYNAKQAERDKQAAQQAAEIESQEKLKAKLAAEIQAQSRKLDDLTAKVAGLEGKHGRSLRIDDLDKKIKERELLLREANEHWAQLVKKVEAAA